MRRGVDVILAVLFAICALLQWNDPDPLWWILAYGLVALSALAGAFGRLHPMLLGLASVVCLAELLLSAPGFARYLASGDLGSLTGAMAPDKPYVESAREFLGMLLALGALGYYAARCWRGRPVAG